MIKRPLFFIIVSLILGIAGAHFLSVSFLWISLFAFFLILMVIHLIIHAIFHKKFPWILYLLLLSLSLGGIRLYAADYIANRSLTSLPTKSIHMKLQIIDLNNSYEYADTNTITHYYRAKLMSIEETNQNKLDKTINLTLYGDSRQNDVTYHCGDVLSVIGTLQKPKEKSSYAEFDQSLWAKTDNVFFIVKGNQQDATFLSNKFTFLNVIIAMRNHISERFETLFSQTHSALLKSLIIGDRRDIPQDVTDDFSKSGISHILSLSGLHVSILLMLLTVLLGQFPIRRRNRNIISIIVLVFFVMLSGASSCIVRAAICSGLFLLCENIGEDGDSLTSLAISALLMLLYNPYILFSVSFDLSYLCILGIIFFYSPLSRVLRFIKISYIRNTISMTLASQVFVLPLLAATFHNISVVTVVTNLLVLWTLSPIILFGILTAFLSFFPIVGVICHFLCKWLIAYLLFCAHKMASLSFSILPIGAGNLVGLLIYGCILFFIYGLLKKKFRKIRIASLAAALVLIFSITIWHIATNDVIISFVNVGQGDAAVITLPNHQHMIIDGGGRNYAAQSDMSEKTFIPYLEKAGIYTIDYAVLSHFDTDHSLGVLHALENFHVKTLVLPYRKEYDGDMQTKILNVAAKKNIPVLYLKGGDSLPLSVKGLSFQVLSPKTSSSAKDENNQSLVLKMTYGDVSAIFTGDVSRYVLDDLMNDDISCDILKVPHHGSKTGVNESFYQMAHPKYAVIDVGKNNYGQPAKQILQELNKVHARVYRTDLCGDIEITFNSKHIDRIFTFMKGNVS